MLFWKFPEVVTDKGYLELCRKILKERQKLAAWAPMTETLKYLKTCINVEDHILVKSLFLQMQLSHWYCKANIHRHSLDNDLLCGGKNNVFYITFYFMFWVNMLDKF